MALAVLKQFTPLPSRMSPPGSVVMASTPTFFLPKGENGLEFLPSLTNKAASRKGSGFDEQSPQQAGHSAGSPDAFISP
jgi:hypothetical protein